MASIDMEDALCVFTSGSYERYYEYDGQVYHHILDPRTGYPARHTRSVTVIAEDPVLADAAATALFVAGPEHWTDIAASMNIQHVLLLDDKETVYLTPELAGHIHFERKPARIVTLKPREQ